MMRILSWNVNGFRSALRKGCLEPVWREAYDIICFQEVKLSGLAPLREAVPPEYYIYSNLSEDKGRNGVVILTKKEACSVDCAIGHEKFDGQGRYLKIDYPEFSLINLYMPHGGRDKSGLSFKLEAAEALKAKLRHTACRNVIIATDFNIARDDIDVCRAGQNHENIMFTDEERAVVTDLRGLGYRDAFRALYPEKIEYTWWSYAFECRERNIGWRIDYFFVSENLFKHVVKVDVLKERTGSDHCPIMVQIEEG